jgi:hypothetical protein
MEAFRFRPFRKSQNLPFLRIHARFNLLRDRVFFFGVEDSGHGAAAD